MDTISKYVLLLALVICSANTSCSKGTAIKYEIISIQGASWVCNVTSSYVISGSSSESELYPEVILPVCDGDLLYMMNMDEQEFYYRYTLKDGKDLVVTFDTLNANSVSLNGQMKYMELSDDQASWEQFKQLTDPQRKQLSSIYITDPLSVDRLSLLQQHESSLKGTGLLLENEYDSKIMGELLSIFRPEWFISEGSLKLADPKNCMALSDIELLWIQEMSYSGSELIPFCSNLESLIITDWQPIEQELLSLSKSRSLHTVTLAECDFTDFSNIEFPSSLLRLQLLVCDTLSNINGIQELKKLKGISFTGCRYIQGLSEVKDLASLKWFAFPENVSQPEFASILSTLPKLELVELINTTGIEQLYPLKDLPELDMLIVDLPLENLRDLGALQDLELLILPSTLFEENSEWVSSVRTSLPNTQVVPGSGLCLGSGWILILLPFIILSRFLFSNRRSFLSH
jgi:hypothetical protein